MRAIAYYRFSTLEQKKGSSIDRQRASCRAFVESRGWQWTGEELIDEGQSAFSGANLATGKLGDFERKAIAGEYPEGTVLVVERLDRLSRKDIWQATDWLRRIVAAGVGIATVDGSKLYGAGSSIPIGDAFELMLKYSVGNEESAKKSERLSAAFAKKRALLDDGHIMTGALPFWLRIETVDSGRRIVAIPERVDVVRRIYRLSEDGFGREAIAKKLNLEGVAPWGRATGWHKSYVALILKNPAVLGDYQPMTRKGGNGRVPVGDVQRNYFPAIIDADQFATVNSRARVIARTNMAVRGRTLNNLLTGLARCNACGAIMTMTSKVRKGSVQTRQKPGGGTRSFTRHVQESYLVCDHSQRGQCKQSTRYRYERVIDAVLDEVLHLSMDDSMFTSNVDTVALTKRVADLQREHADAAARADTLLEMRISMRANASLNEKWEAADSLAVRLQADLTRAEDELADARAAVPANVHIARVNEVRSLLDDPDVDVRFSARAKVMAALRSTVREIVFNRGKEGMWTLTMRGDAHHFAFFRDGTTFFDIPREGDGTELETVAAIRRRAV